MLINLNLNTGEIAALIKHLDGCEMCQSDGILSAIKRKIQSEVFLRAKENENKKEMEHSIDPDSEITDLKHLNVKVSYLTEGVHHLTTRVGRIMSETSYLAENDKETNAKLDRIISSFNDFKVENLRFEQKIRKQLDQTPGNAIINSNVDLIHSLVMQLDDLKLKYEEMRIELEVLKSRK